LGNSRSPSSSGSLSCLPLRIQFAARACSCGATLGGALLLSALAINSANYPPKLDGRRGHCFVEIDFTIVLIRGHSARSARQGPNACSMSCLISGRSSARSEPMYLHRREDPKSRWALKLREERSWNKASVALANKHARIAWAIFCQRHLSSCRQLLCR
jgi:hypothetical protein